MASPPAGYVEATYITQPLNGTRQSTFVIGWDVAAFLTKTPLQMANDCLNHIRAVGCPWASTVVNQDWITVGVRITKMLETGPLLGEVISPVTGTRAKSSLPPNTSVLVRKSTDAGGRRNRGRIFMPSTYLDETLVPNTGIIPNTELLTLQSTINSWVIGADTAGYKPVIYHTEAPYTPTPVRDMSAVSLLATQRRRMRK